MSDELWIGGGGSVRVATDEILGLMRRLESASDDLRGCRQRVYSAIAVVDPAVLQAAGAAGAADRLERLVVDAAWSLSASAAAGDLLSQALGLGAEGYGVVEQTVSDATRVVAAKVAAALGVLSTTAGLLAVPALIVGGISSAALYVLLQRVAPEQTAQRIASARAELESHRGLLSDPVFVDLVRVAVMSVDDFAAGALFVPPPLVGLMGDEGLGISGFDAAATAFLVGARAAGGLRESRVDVRASRSRSAPVAEGFADRAGRIPTGEEQIRIDRHAVDGGPDTFDVYIGGTRDFSWKTGDEPFDLTSDITSVAGYDSGAYRAVEQAMAAAGIRQGSPITVSGYSQGGLMAAAVAASGDYDVRAVYTLGAPAGQVPVPTTIPWVALEHSDDLVPAVGGTWSTADPVLVRRVAMEGLPESEELVPAHELPRYQETAALADSAEESRVEGVDAAFDAVGQGSASVMSTWYLATRVHERVSSEGRIRRPGEQVRVAPYGHRVSPL